MRRSVDVRVCGAERPLGVPGAGLQRIAAYHRSCSGRALGIKDYRQTFFKPYRVIYRVDGQRVYVYVIVDGRRDMQSLLARRLLGG